jgi:fructose-1,6-bisphosphatase II
MLTRDLSLEMVRVTELAALSASFFAGLGDKEGGDKAAVDAMRHYLNKIHIDGKIIIGEGEKDNAPMLFNGEKLGTGKGPKVDIAVDPVEGTTLLALGQPNAIATIAIAEAGAMLDPGSSYYTKKLAVPRRAKDAIDIRMSPSENLERIAKALNKSVRALTVFVLNKPRHKELIEEIRSVGARIIIHDHGDVWGGLAAALPETDIDVLMGTGGTPEAIIAAAAIKALDGGMQCMFDPQTEDERNTLIKEGKDLDLVYGMDDLIKSDDAFFAATGITGSSFLKGVHFRSRNRARTQSIVMRSRSGTIRYIDAIHNLDKKLDGMGFTLPTMDL